MWKVSVPLSVEQINIITQQLVEIVAPSIDHAIRRSLGLAIAECAREQPRQDVETWENVVGEALAELGIDPCRPDVRTPSTARRRLMSAFHDLRERANRRS